MSEPKADKAEAPKHRRDRGAPPEKTVEVRHMTQEEYRRHIDRDLISKAYALFGWVLFLLLVVFAVGFFFGDNENLPGELVRLFSSILTFLLGYLFATVRH